MYLYMTLTEALRIKLIVSSPILFSDNYFIKMLKFKEKLNRKETS